MDLEKNMSLSHVGRGEWGATSNSAGPYPKGLLSLRGSPNVVDMTSTAFEKFHVWMYMPFEVIRQFS